ncbi:MAG: 50S ribosomal protein L4 [Alphaproteobacteria bacterium]|nr:50S ribosomal protein L4 [Alphaproteobacteria bacterium]
METILFTQQGTKKGTVSLPENLFSTPWKESVVHQVAVGMHANARVAIAHTKDRSEVRGGGKKPWQQKGLGRARHGSIRSPIWRGGGIAHGPRNTKIYTHTISKSLKAKALAMVLAKKAHDNHLVCSESLSWDTPKTKNASVFLTAIRKEIHAPRAKVLIVLPEINTAVRKSFSNIPGIEITTASLLNVKNALQGSRWVVVSPEKSFAVLEKRIVA